ncbi:hypothetical protein EJ04DRAFT_510948 [Polyplosphaeria fusca]|uniref:HFB protein n=1 Tax=Polyplosphaeria fusca TaxID=682080 RepID=A0A9P4R435_9PLEO|nr:hypothetical protein EJ04DRAFT_510948 [Polyplosphaeria fusca]
MKYATILAFAVGAIALPQEASSITSAPASAASAALTPQVSCALACDPADVTCQASCLGIARPNSSQAVETTECAEKCDQGDGSPEATEKYSQCVQSCISNFFPSSQTALAPAAGSAGASSAASGGASATGAAASAASSGASQAPSGTGAEATGASGTPTGAASPSSTTGAANSNHVQAAGAGIAGLVLALFAL